MRRWCMRSMVLNVPPGQPSSLSRWIPLAFNLWSVKTCATTLYITFKTSSFDNKDLKLFNLVFKTQTQWSTAHNGPYKTDKLKLLQAEK